jgi:hypothetical protein
MSKRFPFPNPVNETSARIVAAGAVLLGLAYVVTGNVVVLAALTYGFLARVTTGPAFSPIGLIATRVITPRIRTEHKFVPGPPKRFAQAIGLSFGVIALVLFAVDQPMASRIVIAGLVGAAFLESAFAFCLGCVIFGWLMRRGVIPQHICVACNDISDRLRSQAGRTI